MTRKAALIMALGALLTTGCTSADEPPPRPDYTGIVPDEPGRGKVDDATVELELAVYDALESHPYEKATRYYPDTNEMVVTIWTLGDEPSRRSLEQMQEQAQEAAGDAEVSITLVNDQGESQDWTP